MKKLYLVFLLAAIGTFGRAQFGFDTPINQLCFDGQTALQVFQHWEAYQTLDNLYNGTIDSTVCINLGNLLGMAELPTAEFDPTKPVFLRWHSDDGYYLEPNMLYALSIYLNMDMINTDVQDCEDNVCNGFIVRVRVPDNPNDFDLLPEYRTHVQEFVLTEFGNISVCLPTESFLEGTYIEDIVLKMYVQPDAPSLQVYDPFLEYVWSSAMLTTNEMLSYQTDQFNYSLWPFTNYVVQYQETTFPALEAISYLDVSPVPNIAELAVVNLTLQEYASLSFQPFTALRGALVEGQTEQRHILSIINNGTVCMNFWFELVMPPGGTFTYQRGKIESSWGSCMRFVPDATLRVGQDAVLEFGEQGMGMLATQSGALIDLEENAQLVLHCPLRMFNEPWQTNIENVHVYLKPGNALVFGPDASLENFSTDATMKLVVHLQGGYLDMANLSNEERKHIELVYEDAVVGMDWVSQESLVTDGEWNGACRVQGQSPLTWEVYNSAGQRMWSSTLPNDQPYVQMSFATGALAKGLYTLVVIENGQRIATKLMVQ